MRGWCFAVGLSTAFALCVGPPPVHSPTPTTANSDLLASTAADSMRPAGFTEPTWVNWGSYFLPDEMTGKTIHLTWSPMDADRYAEDPPDRPAYVQIWNRTGLAAYAEFTRVENREASYNVTFPADPPYLFAFFQTTSGHLTALVPPGRYFFARGIQNAVQIGRAHV